MSANIDPKTLSKIKKCLALSASDNPHEAAAAMRQAKAMMDRHGISASHITMSEIGESRAKSATMARDKPANWEVALAGMVGKTFGCKMMIGRGLRKPNCGFANSGNYIFVGLKQQAEMASYTASVLIRKCKKARSTFITEELSGLASMGRGMKAKATRMGDAFAEGWVLSIQKMVTTFANPLEVESAIEQHIEEQSSGDNAPVRAIKRSQMDDNDMMAVGAGMRAAEGESIHRPIAAKNNSLMICN